MLTTQQIQAAIRPLDNSNIHAGHTIGNETHSIETWLEYYGVSKATYYRRIKAGKSVYDAITKQPINTGRRVSRVEINYRYHKRAFLLRLQGKTYQQISWAINCSYDMARRLVLLDNPADRKTIQEELT